MSWRKTTIPIIITIVLSAMTLILLNWRFQSNGLVVQTTRLTEKSVFVEHSTPWVEKIKSLPPKVVTIAFVTAYSSTKDQTDDTPFITASQTRVRDGIVACPRKYEFGSKFEIKGKEYVCEDRMNIRYTNRFDIWFPTKRLAKLWGKQKLKVIIK